MSNSDVYDQLQVGIQHHQNGDLEAADAIYRKILDEYPNHPDALHLLGVIAFQVGEYGVAEELIDMAINSNLQVADYHNNLGEVYLATGREEEAARQYRLALDIDPEHYNARKNLEQLLAGIPGQGPQAPGQAQLAEDLLPQVRHALPSYLFSQDDEPYAPNRKLIEISLAAGLQASQLDFPDLPDRFPEETAKMINVWPGEHYRFLAALITVMQPQLIIEIGTATGASALAMKAALPENSRIVTYDVIPWDQYPGSGLVASDLDDQLEQRIVDLSDPAQAQYEIPLLEHADLFFVDAAKDYVMEKQFCLLFDKIRFSKNPIMVFDDIRTMNMLKIWREIHHPKLDITSYGHWSGTGLVDWTS